MHRIYIQLLGQFSLRNDRQPVVSLVQPRLQALLAYLACQGDAFHTRQSLAFLFWPDSSEAQARTNVRKLILHLRRAWAQADDVLVLDGNHMGWRAAVTRTVDVQELEHALAAAEQTPDPAAIPALQAAVDLYTGDLLPDLYEPWILDYRDALRDKVGRAMERLLLLLEDQRDYGAAIALAQRYLRHDPLQESTYRRLMRLYALTGERAAALHTYQQCVAILQEELDAEPGVETQEAYARLQNHQTPPVLRAARPSPLDRPPFVGRRAEWQRLQSAWRDVMRGHARLLVITGEAGMGKTRLAEELLEWAEHQGILTARAHAYAAEGRLAYAPIIEWLRTPALQTRLAQLDATWQAEVARLLPELAQPAVNSVAGAVTDPTQRHRLYEALARGLLVDSAPVLLLLDDLQWADQETLAWLHFLLRYAPRAKLFVVGTVRQSDVDLQDPLVNLLLNLRATAHLLEMEVTALDVTESATLAGQMVGQAVEAEAARQLYRETEGHPLYIVEMVRAHYDQQTGFGPELFAAHASTARQDTARQETAQQDTARQETAQQDTAQQETAQQDTAQQETAQQDTARQDTPLRGNHLPPRIHTVIETRLAQLSPQARQVAELAAAVGRDFRLEVLAQARNGARKGNAGSEEDEELAQALDELLQRQIVRERESAEYDFSHDKLREVIYSKLSTVRRRILHRRIALALETIQAESQEIASGQIAAHYEAGGLPQQAVPAYGQAAQAAMRVYALGEAADLFQRGLRLLDDLPDTTQWLRQKLDLLLGLGTALVNNYGYGYPPVRDVYLRAQETLTQLGAPPNPAIMRGLAIYHIVHREYALAEAQGNALYALAQNAADAPAAELNIEAGYVLGAAAYWRGNFAESRAQFTQALTHHDPARSAHHIALYSQDPGVICYARLGVSLWVLGYPDQAHTHCATAIELGRKINHPFSCAYSLYYSIMVYLQCGNTAAFEIHLDELQRHCDKHDLKLHKTSSGVLHAYTLAKQQATAANIAHLERALVAHRVSQSAGPFNPLYAALTADLHLRAGDPATALHVIDTELVDIETYGDYYYSAELLRLRGEARQQQGAPAAEVAAQLQEALTLAQQQQALALELRAAMSLCRLWQTQGETARARQLLQAVYAKFTEGFATADLQAAQALLQELR